MYSSTSAEATHTDAAVAQSVERRIGSAEVTGPIPVSSFIEKKRKSLNERVCAFLCYGVTVLRYYDECIVMEVWMRGEYTVEALMLSRGQGESRKTFSRPAGLNDTFLLLDPIFASIRVWFALFLFSDPDCSFLPSLCQPFSILSGSGTHFFCSGTQFLLLYGSGSHFFSSQTRGALLFWHYVNLFPILYGSGTRFFSSGTSPFPSISPGFQFV